MKSDSGDSSSKKLYSFADIEKKFATQDVADVSTDAEVEGSQLLDSSFFLFDQKEPDAILIAGAGGDGCGTDGAGSCGDSGDSGAGDAGGGK